MLYMVSMKASGKLGSAPLEFIEKFRSSVAEALAKGSMKAACVKVGGGMVLIVDSPSNAHLAAELRKHQIVDAEVVPVVPLVDLLDAYVEMKKAQ